MRLKVSLLLSCFGSAIVVLLFQLYFKVQAQSTNDGYKTFSNSIVKLPPSAQSNVVALNNDTRQTPLLLHFALHQNNQKEYQARVDEGEIVSPQEKKEKYSGNEKDFKALVSWLKNQGFEIVQTSDDYTSVFARAKVDQIEKSLGVKMANVTYKGITTPSATNAPKLPISIGDNVVAIDGLQPWVQAVKHMVPRDPNVEKRGAQQNPPIPRPAISTRPSYKIKDILKAYDADGLGTGIGQEIAILIDTFPASSDLQKFWQKNALTVNLSQIQLINVQGHNTTLPAREGEETLDTEWTSGIASGAKTRVYASSSLGYTYLDMALEQIYKDAQVSPGLRQVSISLGLREDLVSAGEVSIEQKIFLDFAAAGVTVFVSSGDAGSNPDETGQSRGPDSVVEYEASDLSTIAVGGTTLHLDPHDKVLDETGWFGSGGGVSSLFARPGWQKPFASISIPNRLVPDVSSVADPNPGAFVWFNGKELPVGGTSWSTPTWAGFCALIREARQKQGKPALGFLAPLLYRLPSNSAFRDITSGTNGTYNAGSGWDPVTGLGVPDVKALIQALP